MLGDRDKANLIFIEKFDHLSEIGQGARQAVDFVYHHHTDLSGLNVSHDLLERRPLHIAA